MTTEQTWRSIIPVESFAQDFTVTAEVEKPEVGLCWGKSSQFTHSAQEGTDEEGTTQDGSSGEGTLIRPRKYRDIVRTTTWEPIWKAYEIRRIYNPDDTEEYIDVKVYVEFLILLSSGPFKKLTGYRPTENGVEGIWTTITLNTYLQFALPPSDIPMSELLRKGTDGIYPSYPEEIFPGG